jgi:drug/metabolite transporter (DMT)-like permease
VLLAGVVAASSSSILIRYAQQDGIASLAIAAWRMVLASLVLLPLALATRRQEFRGLAPSSLAIALLAGLFLAAHFTAWISSLEHTSVASSAALVTTNPVWVGLATVLILRERLPRLTIAGIAVSLLGCLMIIWVDYEASHATAESWTGRVAPDEALPASAGGRQPMLGNALALAGAVCISAYLLTGRRIAARVSLLAYVTLVYGAAAVVLMLAAVAAGVELWRYPATGWAALAGLALVPQLIGHTAFNWSLRRLSPTFVALSILGEPVGSAILASILFAEIPSGLQLAAFATLLVGIAVAALGEHGARGAAGPPAADRAGRAG